MRNVIFISVLALGMALTANTNANAQAPTYPPSVLYATVLNGVKVHPTTGRFRFEHIQALFLPDISGNMYSPENGGTLTSNLKYSDGSTVAEIAWYAEKRKAPYWLLSSYKLRKPGNDWNSDHDFKLTNAGDYTLEFLLDGKIFYRFPFSLEVLGSNDPYNPQSIYRFNGAWNDYAYLMYTDADVSKSLQFKIWLRNDGTQKRKDVKVTGSLRHDGKEIAKFGEFPLNYSLSADWVRYEMPFGQFKNTQFNTKVWHTSLKANELLSNGKYEVVVEIDGKMYGIWPFTVKDGQVERVGVQDRAVTDPLDFLEGGKDSFWSKRSK